MRTRLRAGLNNLPDTLRADLILSCEITETFARSVPSTYYAIALFLIYALLYRYWIMGVAEGDVEDNLLGQTQIIKMDCLAPRSPVGVMRRYIQRNVMESGDTVLCPFHSDEMQDELS